MSHSLQLLLDFIFENITHISGIEMLLIITIAVIGKEKFENIGS